jgi:hypothetical protein
LEPLASAELDRIAQAQQNAEEKGILDMLLALGIDPIASRASRACANGHDQVNIRIAFGDTQDLPPTASKPDAVYNPEALYSDPEVIAPLPSGP